MTRRSVLSLGLTFTIFFIGLILAPRESVAGTPNFPKMDIKLAHVIPAETSVNKGALKFAELMKERTGGAINVQVFPNGQLGSEKDIVEQVRNGLIHMATIGGTFLANIDGWGISSDQKKPSPRQVRLRRTPGGWQVPPREL